MVDNTATEEKKYMTKDELNTLNIPKEYIYTSQNNDTLVLNETKYIMSRTPITALYEKAGYILYEGEEIGKTPKKRYILNWEVKNDSLYIVDYHLSTGYQGNKTKEHVKTEIERLWGKEFKHGKLVVDWMILKDTPVTTVKLLVSDSTENLYCLVFENNRFIRIEEITK